jgi:hypothetical protein
MKGVKMNLIKRNNGIIQCIKTTKRKSGQGNLNGEFFIFFFGNVGVHIVFFYNANLQIKIAITIAMAVAKINFNGNDNKKIKFKNKCKIG